ncbi:BspA family leucine-rich repeat surface protein [Bifidobacterium sp. ESL0790]|uniref:BspA family leucine-rich repeat surface protein n=1 Tax=Bifidobacterium sp. ESL0790 TaxID=2983233 RepID=UPI0023F70C45|nr:BspA family leucine-rich repeat surface protein [Bifidobacterium sp. ESL0790]WEV72230.1 BspA family leucine-rich repeat surface protein [Bifidobacterium sp. ESL0790]
MLELESGTIPVTGSSYSSIPWRTDISYTRLAVTGHVTTTNNQALFNPSSPYGDGKLKSADVTNLDVSGATTLKYFFAGQPQLTEITGIGQWDTGNVTDTGYMFNNDPNLTKVDLSENGSHWDTSNVTNMDYMFNGDAELYSIGVPGLKIPSGVNSLTNHMFDGCVKLVHCQQPGEHVWTYGGKTLNWNEHLVDNQDGTYDCVLELESGDVPVTGSSYSSIPWRTDISYTRLAVTGHVTTTNNQALFNPSSPYGDGKLKSADVANLDVSGATTLKYFFAGQPQLTEITGIGQWDTGNVTDTGYMFNNDPNLTKVDLSENGSHWDTSNVTNMDYMFNGDAELYSVGSPGLEVPGGINCWTNHMFDGCVKLIRCGQPGPHTWTEGGSTLHWKETMSGTFENPECELELQYGTIPDTGTTGDSSSSHVQWKDPGISKLVVDAPGANGPVRLSSGYGIFDTYFMPNLKTADVTHLDTSASTNMAYMFHDQANLTEITGLDQWDTGLVTDMSHMFQNCPKLTGVGDLSGWHTGNVTSMANMFTGGAKLASVGDLSGWHTGKVTSMDSMFKGCAELTSVGDLHAWDTGLVTSLNAMFQGDAKLSGGLDSEGLRTFDVSGWHTGRVTDFRNVFDGCARLESLDISGFDMGAVGTMRPQDLYNNEDWMGDRLTLNFGMISAPNLVKIRVGSGLNMVGSTAHWFWSYDRREHKTSPLLGDRDINYPASSVDCSINANCRVGTPVYLSQDRATVMRGDQQGVYANPASSTWLYRATSYEGDGGNVTTCPEAVHGEHICTTATKALSRLNTWKDADAGVHTLDEDIPWSVPGDKLTAQWQSLDPPGINKATPHADGTLTVHGTLPGGTLADDQFTTYPYASASGGTHGTTAQSAKVTELTATAPADANWETTYTAATNPYPADKVGSGVSYWFTSTLTQHDLTTSSESARKQLTIDTVAPGVVDARTVNRAPDSGVGVQVRVHGVAWTSGDQTNQPQRATEAGDRVTITWPDGSTTGAKLDGTPLDAGDPGAIVTGSDGSFDVDVPAGTNLSGGSTASVTVWDNADGDGTTAGHPAGLENKANKTTVTVRLTPPTVDKLPLTGHNWGPASLVLLTVVAALAIATSAYAQYRRSRH